MKHLFLALLAACSACNLADTDTRQPVVNVAPVMPAVPSPPVDPRTTRPNGSCAYYDYRIVHNEDAAAFAAEVNQLLDKGYFFRGELRTSSGVTGKEYGFEYVQAMSKQ